MTNRPQILRSSTPGQVPAAGTRLPGELWTTFPDLQLGVIDASKNAQRLIAVRFFSTSANYAAGDFIVQGGKLWFAKGAITAGAFNATQWTQIAVLSDIPPAYTLPTASPTVLGGVKIDNSTIKIDGSGVISSGAGFYLPLAGGTLTGPLLLNADPGAALGAATKQYADNMLPLAGGTLTGSLILKADPGALLEAATKQYVDTKAGLYLPLAGGVLTGSLTGASATFSGAVATGALTVNGAATFAGNPVKISLPAGAAFANCPTIDAPAGTVRGLFGSTNGSPRWRVTLGNGGPETGANAGSDFAISSYDDSGALLNNGFFINRANNIVNIVGVGGGSWSGTGAASVGSCVLALNKAASGTAAQILGNVGGASRWQIGMGNASLESGANVGSDWQLSRYNDAGTGLGNAMVCNRASGVVTFSAAIVNGPSDRTLKENIAPIEDALDKVNALQGVSFNMLATPDKREIGLIAQDVEPVVPEIMQLFSTSDEEGKSTGDYLSLDYPKLTALLIEAVKELTARVAELEARRVQ